MNWIKSILRKLFEQERLIYDGFDVIKHYQPDYSYHLEVAADGKLIFTDQDNHAVEVEGVDIWCPEVKEDLRIDNNAIVLDFFIVIRS